jgi:putative flippase GtrA
MLVGVVNTLFGMTIMFVLYNVFGVSYWWSSAANYFFGSILSFMLNKRFTFQHHGDWWRSALRFTLHILVCYLVAYGLAKPLAMWCLSDYGVTIQENVAMLVGATLFVVLNYLGQRFFAFRESKQK